jgi:hypothetical protein
MLCFNLVKCCCEQPCCVCFALPPDVCVFVLCSAMPCCGAEGGADPVQRQQQPDHWHHGHGRGVPGAMLEAGAAVRHDIWQNSTGIKDKVVCNHHQHLYQESPWCCFQHVHYQFVSVHSLTQPCCCLFPPPPPPPPTHTVGPHRPELHQQAAPRPDAPLRRVHPHREAHPQRPSRRRQPASSSSSSGRGWRQGGHTRAPHDAPQEGGC